MHITLSINISADLTMCGFFGFWSFAPCPSGGGRRGGVEAADLHKIGLPHEWIVSFRRRWGYGEAASIAGQLGVGFTRRIFRGHGLRVAYGQDGLSRRTVGRELNAMAGFEYRFADGFTRVGAPKTA